MDDIPIAQSHYPTFKITREQLGGYKDFRYCRLKKKTQKSLHWFETAADFLYTQTGGIITEESVKKYNNYINGRFQEGQVKKHINFTKDFFRQYHDLHPYINLFVIAPVIQKVDQQPDIVTLEDVRNSLSNIALNFKDRRKHKQSTTLCFALFCSYTGVRPETLIQISAGEFRKALESKPEVLVVDAQFSKNGRSFKIPIHPQLIPHLRKEIEELKDDETVFDFRVLNAWHGTTIINSKTGKKEYPYRIPLVEEPEKYFQTRHYRKFFQNYCHKLKLDLATTNFIMNHELTSIVYKNYLNKTSSEIYDEYMSEWGSVNLLEGIVSQNDECPISQVIQTFESMIGDIESIQSIEEIFSKIDDIISETSTLMEEIKILNQGRDKKDQIDIPPELPSSNSIRLWINADTVKIVSKEKMTQEQADEYQRICALEYFHKYYDQYCELHEKCLNCGLFIRKVVNYDVDHRHEVYIE